MRPTLCAFRFGAFLAGLLLGPILLLAGSRASQNANPPEREAQSLPGADDKQNPYLEMTLDLTRESSPVVWADFDS